MLMKVPLQLINDRGRQGRSTMHVLGKSGTIKCNWLVDTSSDVTCISANLPSVDQLKLSPPRSTPTTANGSHLGCIGEVSTKVHVGHVVQDNVRVLVIKNLNTAAILGMDFLTTFGTFGIDWTKGALILGDKRVILEKRKHGSVLSPAVVSLISDHTIPARSQCFVTGKQTSLICS